MVLNLFTLNFTLLNGEIVLYVSECWNKFVWITVLIL